MILPNLQIKLNHKNYYIWRSTIISALEAFGLENFIVPNNAPSLMITSQPNTEQTQSTSIPNPEYTTWKKNDILILLWIRSHLCEQMLGHIARTTTTADALQAIDQSFQAESQARVNQLHDDLHRTPKGNMSIMEYVQFKGNLADDLAAALQPVPESELINDIIAGLGSDYGNFQTGVNLRPIPLTFNELLGALLKEEQRIVDDHKNMTPSAHIASRSHNSTQPRSLSNNNRSSSFKPSQSYNGKQRPTCQICGKIGHEARNCYHRYNEHYPPTRRSERKPQALFASTSTIPDPEWHLD